jgi:hypothetical protein
MRDEQGDGGMGTDDAGEERRAGPGRGLRSFRTVLDIVCALLGAGTILAALFLCAWCFTGFGQVTFPAEIDPPYRIETPDGRKVKTDEIDFPLGEEQLGLVGPPSVHAQVEVGHDDVGARAIVTLGMGTGLALTWVWLVNLRRIVHRTLAGWPFRAEDVRGLRRAGAAFLACPLVMAVEVRALEPRVEVDLPVHLQTPGPSWLVYVMVGTGLLALAELFREGARLRVLEEATV